MFFCAGIFGWVPALFMDKTSANAGLWVICVSLCRVVLGGYDWQIASSRDCFVPLYENKASLSQPDLMFLGVTCAS